MSPQRKTRRRRIKSGIPALCLAALFLAAGLGVWFFHTHRGLPGERVKLPDYVQKDYLTVNPYSRPGTELKKINGIVIHYVGNPGTTARANRSYFESLSSGADGVYASAHFIVGLDAEVLQCIPLTEISYASNHRNDDTIAIEVCHPDDTGKFSGVTYRRVVDLTAWLCDQLDLTADDVIRHYDVTGKDCPKYYVEHPEAWAQFRTDVQDALAALQKSDG